MLNKILQSAKRGARGDVKSLSGSTYGGGWAGNQWGSWGQQGLDFNKQAGVRWDNSIVFSILSFAATQVNAVPIVTQKKDSDEWVTIPDHPITLLLNKPNPWYDGSLMTTAMVWQEGAWGNSYAFKHRSRGGKVIALEVMPQGTCYPWTRPGSGDWITEYRLATSTGYYPAPPEDVLHMRWMIPNPVWLQLGLSPIDGALPELVSDKKASQMEGALLTNSGVSPQAISPRRGDDLEGDEFTEAQAEQIRDKIEAQASGGNVGRPIVFGYPIDVQKLGFDPSQLALNDVHDFSEERLCAVFGVPPVVVGLGTGLDKSNNRASMEAAVDLAFDRFVIPYLRHRGKLYTEDLVPELGQEGERVIYDEAYIPALKKRVVAELMGETGGPIKTPNEGRQQIGLDPVEGGDTLRQGNSSALSAKEVMDA